MFAWDNILVAFVVAGAAAYLVWHWRNRRNRSPASGCRGDCVNCPMWAQMHDCVDPPRRREVETTRRAGGA